MKSVLQAGWLLTVAVGNVIVLIVAEGAGLEQVGQHTARQVQTNRILNQHQSMGTLSKVVISDVFYTFSPTFL